MVADVYMNTITLNDFAWHTIADTPMVLDATFYLAPMGLVTSGSGVIVMFREGQEADWPFGNPVHVEGVDISKFKFMKSSINAKVTVVGYSRSPS